MFVTCHAVCHRHTCHQLTLTKTISQLCNPSICLTANTPISTVCAQATANARDLAAARWKNRSIIASRRSGPCTYSYRDDECRSYRSRSSRDDRCSLPVLAEMPAEGGPAAGVATLRLSRSSRNLDNIFRSSWYPRCICHIDQLPFIHCPLAPSGSPSLRSDPPAGDPSPAPTDMHRTHRIREAFGGQTPQTCP